MLSLSVCAVLLVAGVRLVWPSVLGRLPVSILMAIGLSFPYYMWTGSNDAIFSAAGQIVQQNRITFLNRTGFILVSTFLVIFAQISLVSYLLVYGTFNILQMYQEIRFLAKNISGFRRH